MKNWILLTLLIPMIGMSDTLNLQGSGSTTVTVSLSNQDVPANDLIYQNRILSPQEANALKRQGLDLSTLDPDPTTDLWSPKGFGDGTALDNGLPIQSAETSKYQGKLSASNGFYKINVQTASGGSVTLMFGRTMHTFLLRKAVFRALGYKIPPMKYIPTVKIQFPNIETIYEVISEIPVQALAAAKQWCLAPKQTFEQIAALQKQNPKKFTSNISCGENPIDGDPLTLDFQDLLAIETTPLLQNVALSVPIVVTGNPQTDGRLQYDGRLLRVLSIVDGLFNVPESINQMSWYVATVSNNNVTFEVPDLARFNCSLDDTRWILKILAKLDRQSFVKIVEQASLPKPVADLITEKLIARRNSLMKSFALNIPDIKYDVNISSGPALKNGKLLQVDWPGYGSRFAWGDQESPLKDLRFYFWMQLQSNIMSNLIGEFNRKLPGLYIKDQAENHISEMRDKAYAHWLKTGQNQVIDFGNWVAPIASGGVNVNRSIVVGEYLGTNNIIQLVDTCGVFFNAGIYLGFDGLTSSQLLNGVIKGGASITYTHLKPVKELKETIKEPFKNLFIPRLMFNTADILKLAAAVEKDSTVTLDSRKDKIANELNQLENYLGVGESLIVTYSLNGTQGMSAGIADLSTPIAPSLNLAVSSNQVVLSRLHFLRKDKRTIMIFKDRGELIGAKLSLTGALGMPVSYPIFNLAASAVAGGAHDKIFSIDLTSDPKDNPNIFKNLSALATALTSTSTEVLETQIKPTVLEVKFKDRSVNFNFLWWVNRWLKTSMKMHVTLPDGTQGNYIDLTDGDQSGNDYQSTFTDVATYILQRLTKSGQFSIDTQSAPNPGHTFYGKSKTREAEFQANTDKGITLPTVKINYRWEGWDIKTGKMRQRIALLNNYLKFQLYPGDVLMDTEHIQLYSLRMDIYLYASAIDKILSLSPDELEKIVDRSMYNEDPERTGGICYIGKLEPGREAIGKDGNCWDVKNFRDMVIQYQKRGGTPEEKAKLAFKAINSLEQFVDFENLVAIAGGPGNIFLTSTIQGFRVGSETVSEPIKSNTFGKIDPLTPFGILDYIQNLIGVNTGEFKMNWIRSRL